jgi:ABC-type glycerol-3-phosphate transport system substrate-binding protein
LQALQAYTGDPAFSNNSFDNSFIKMLLIAFGGTPVDLEVDPTLASLTDPANVEAVRQVLDLAKNGIIDYQALAATGGFGGGIGGNDIPPISSQTMSDIDWGFGDPNTPSIFDGLLFVPYPRGSQFLPLAYQIKGAYISSQSPNPEACYRLIRAIAQQPDLFSGMPAQRSTIAQISTERADLYQSFVTLLEDPNARIVSSQFGSFEQYLTEFIINRAYDRYVLEDADLLIELEEARAVATAVATCIDGLPDLGEASTPEEAEARFNDQRACAVNVDPALSELFPPIE